MYRRFRNRRTVRAEFAGCRQSTVRRTNHRLAYRNVLAAVGWYSLLENNFRRVLLRIVTLYIKIFNLKTSELS